LPADLLPVISDVLLSLTILFSVAEDLFLLIIHRLLIAEIVRNCIAHIKLIAAEHKNLIEDLYRFVKCLSAKVDFLLNISSNNNILVEQTSLSVSLSQIPENISQSSDNYFQISENISKISDNHFQKNR